MDNIRSLSVGQASGLLALGTQIATYTIPLLVGLFLLRYHNKEASAATWSVIARQLHSSSWPSLLRTDSAAVRNVERRVTSMVFTGGLLSLLTLVAGIVTPLGFHEEVQIVGNQTVEFSYLRDVTSFGKATQHRPEKPLSRDCGSPTQVCPGAAIDGPNVTVSVRGGVLQVQPSTADIPQDIWRFFTSYSKVSTVASIFDLQYRFWKRSFSANIDSNQPYVSGLYRQVNNLIPLGYGTMLIEGNVVDMEHGGIGYRNHSAPEVSATWEEDILWVAPDLSCASTNLSFEMTLQPGDDPDDFPLTDVELVDDGGFSNMWSGDLKSISQGIESLDVQTRATEVAQVQNKLLSMIFNITDPTTSGRYPLDLQAMNSSLSTLLFPLKPTSTSLDVSWYGLPIVTMNTDGSLNTPTGRLDIAEQYPYQYAAYLLTQLQHFCTGGASDQSTFDGTPTMACSYFLSSPYRIDSGSVLEEEAGSRWKTSIRICAGTVRASVKTISYTHNSSATPSLDNTKVTALRDKSYASESEYPLWATEDWRSPGKESALSTPLWGLVSPAEADTPGYTYVRAPTFLLPPSSPARWQMTATGSGRADVNLKDMLAGTIAPRGVLTQVLTSAFATDQMWLPNYSGLHCLALRSKWAEMSKTAEGSADILSLVWTDIMASVTVGTKMHPSMEEIGQDSLTHQTYVQVRAPRLSFHAVYAIPGIVLLVLYTLLAIFSLPVIFSNRPFAFTMRCLLNNTSLGRNAAVAQEQTRAPGNFHARAHAYVSTWEWLRKVGTLKMRIGEEVVPYMRGAVGGYTGWPGYGGGEWYENGTGPGIHVWAREGSESFVEVAREDKT
ncbi:hypothetical protein EJ05DRAFT_18244 [Pseudovirgaria hyperparasitica]|uniref:Uncharacterized protein n=1 Tax=Pseudovirgaria hyperparasitica TaxID=470096 RepID=A0A6A6WL03_9PEZI|nr:uncharacterized protein EJ05DRAFT_18244 [Pseudovirgaria hyperparasitica]KAF2762880.1 hypothetical protein EJ05DRAFT_18244 [Pseudovirgaria hyperparasitica]